MTEWQQVGLVLHGLLLLVAFALCYLIGGRQGKWVRRFVGGLVFPVGCILLAQRGGTFQGFMWSSLVAYPVALSMGYGGETIGEKLRRRARYGLGLGAAGLCLLVPAGHLVIGLWQVALAVLASVGYGTTNPIPAVAEEGQIAILSTCLIPFAMLR